MSTSEPRTEIRSFLKWPGGKRWLVPVVLPIIRSRLKGKYIEPFLGGGSVFFALQPACALLSDINPEIITVYRHVRDRPRLLIDKLKSIRVSEEVFYRLRASQPRTALLRAIRFLYLNRTAFSGLYRVNSRGRFNVPYGGGERRPDILWVNELLVNASGALRRAQLLNADFEEVIARASSGDVVYCDPTYTVTHNNNGFRRYNENNYSWNDQERLAQAARRAAARGATVIVSNAHHDEIRALYSPHIPIVLERSSTVAPKVKWRRRVSEFLFVIHPQPSMQRVAKLNTISIRQRCAAANQEDSRV